MSPPLLLDDHWKDVLHLQHRTPPELFERNSEVRSTLYAPAVQIGFQELGLSAIFCMNAVPTVAIRRSSEYDPIKVHEIRSALWSQGLASIYVDIADASNTVRVFSLARSPILDPSADSEDAWLIERIKVTTDSVRRLHSYITGVETGRIWIDRPDLFPNEQRIDAVLLNSLTVAHDELRAKGLSTNQAQAALTQTMFIAFLEDRKLINSSYFQSATNGQRVNWNYLLKSGDIAAFERLFDKLQSDFNGDMFLTPCTLLECDPTTSLTRQHLEILMRFRGGTEVMSRGGGGQTRFRGYNFRYTPIELISAAYDRFLCHDQEPSKLKGAYYTPMILADTVVSELWEKLTDEQKSSGHFFDPACGSGIFLVKIFQRLCQHHIETTSDDSAPSREVLLTILDRIRGQDDNPAAVRIAALSLYLAVLEQATRGHALNPLDATRRLPNLCDKVLARYDFFDPECPMHNADVIIGNPPWSSHKGGHPPANRWANENNYHLPQKEIAWAFTWKALHHLNEGGVLAFLVPTMGFFHNQATSLQARSRLVRDSQFKVVVDFSDLRCLLFPSATRSASLVIARKSTSSSSVPHVFEYLVPKADPNLFTERFIGLRNDDRKLIRSKEIKRSGLALKQRLWIRAPELGLFQYLSSLPTLGNYIRTYTHKNPLPSGAIIRGGFQPLTDPRLRSKTKASDVLHRIPYLPSKCFSPLTVDLSGLSPWPSRKVHRLGFEAAFLNPCILLTSEVSTRNRRIRAAYVKDPVSFQDPLMAMIVPSGQESMGKFITSILNSRLAIWFAFHGTKTFGAERLEIGGPELLRLPLPMPTHLSEASRAEELQHQLVQEFDNFAPGSSGEPVSAGSTELVLQRIDQLAYDYFGLGQNEIAMVEETVDCVLPSVHPSPSRFPDTWRDGTLSDRRAYAGTFAPWLSDWFSDGASVSVRMFASNADYAILEASLSPGESNPYTESDTVPFPEAVVELERHLGRTVAGNFCVMPDVRIFAGSKLYLVKPLQKRFWLHASALADAGGIVADLEAAWQQSRMERGGS